MVWLWIGTVAVVFVLARALRPTLDAPALRRVNYAGRDVVTAGGIVAVVGFAVSLGFASVLDSTDANLAFPSAVAVFGFAAIGLFDDVIGSHTARGFRGHVAALRRGELTSGMAKLVAGLGVAGVTSVALSDGVQHRLLDVVIIAGSANVANLLDLRPARAYKAAVIVSIGLLLATRGDDLVASDLWFVAAVAGLLPAELREELMLGDTGSNAMGAALGVAVVCACASSTAWLLTAAAVVVAVNVAGELVSFGRVIDSVAPLRAFDRLGRRP
ncbi:MAG: hypothetical protein QOF21_1335 [Actinomycetota bacterium]|jgi:UDP-N-acetylmuramyl pentapeptide phosphotransferase/UDP-N-acetylglucosamine-1-phosphate transferase